MGLFLYPFLIIGVYVGLKLLLLKAKFNKSQYQLISGNNFLKTIYDKGNYGEYLTFCMLEKVSENNILTNIYLPKKDGTTTEIDLFLNLKNMCPMHLISYPPKKFKRFTLS